MSQHILCGLKSGGGGQNNCCPSLEAQAEESDTGHGTSRQKHLQFVFRGDLLAVKVSGLAFGCMMLTWHCYVMQGPDVITFVSPTNSQVSILNATNAVVTDEAPGVANLTAAVAIPQGTYANFSVLINATSQACCQQLLCMTILLFCMPASATTVRICAVWCCPVLPHAAAAGQISGHTSGFLCLSDVLPKVQQLACQVPKTPERVKQGRMNIPFRHQ